MDRDITPKKKNVCFLVPIRLLDGGRTCLEELSVLFGYLYA